MALAEENARLSEMVRERSLLALLKDKRPFRNMTASSPHVQDLKHPIAELVRVTYDYDDDIEIPWNAPYTQRQTPIIQSETDIQSAVHAILTSISSKMWKGKVLIHQNRRVMGTECDHLLTYGPNSIPYSACEIKKKGGEDFVSAIFEDGDEVHEKLKGKVQGEHFVQLATIRLFGQKKVFGLISDGNHSMITCTSEFTKDDLHETATQQYRTNAAPTPNKRPRPSPSLEGDEKYISPDNKIEFDDGAQFSQEADTDETRKLYCSHYTDVIKEGGNGDDADWNRTVKMFTHFLCLGFNSVDPHLFTRKIKLNETLPARGMKISHEGNDLVYKSEQFAHTSIRFDKQPNVHRCLLSNNAVNTVKLLKHLGLGVNGDCCLGTTIRGESFCAVKFFADRNNAYENAKKEQSAWNTIYDCELPKVLLVKLPPVEANTQTWDACICMPYLVPVDSTADRQAALDSGMIEDRLKAFAVKNYHHNEAGVWRHWGEFCIGQNEEKYSPFLCDLGNLTKRADTTTDDEWEESTATWITKCLEQLGGSIGAN